MKDCPVEISKMVPVDLIAGDSAVDTNLLREMAAEAKTFILEQKWCESVDRAYLAYGVGGVVAIFLLQITPRSEDVDTFLWVIVGDLPPAYVVVDDNPTAADALDGYCSEMETWVEAVESGECVEELIPVNAAPTRENAAQLGGRLKFLRSKILPLIKAH
jgi:hypothetical protein